MKVTAAPPHAPGPLEVLTLDQLCQRLGVSRDTVRELRADGLPTIRLGARELRFVWPTVVAWLERHRPAQGTAPALKSHTQLLVKAAPQNKDYVGSAGLVAPRPLRDAVPAPIRSTRKRQIA